jgi:hypothetical protein
MRKVPIRPIRLRRGATLVELAISLMVLLSCIMALIELSMLVLRNQQITEVSRHVARAVSVRGNLANQLGSLGPGQLSGNGGDGTTIGTLISQRLAVPDLESVTYTVTWIDGGNDARDDHRITVSISYPHNSIMAFFGRGSWILQASTIVHIVH